MARLCEVADGPRELAEVANALRLMEIAQVNYRHTHQAFIAATQAGDWQKAEVHRTDAIAYLESSMDAFTQACRLQSRP